MGGPAMNDEDFIPMSRDEFERLPMDVQVATLERIRHQRRFMGECVESRAKRRLRAALYGAFAAGVLSPLIGPNWYCFGTMLVFGALCGVFFVAKNVNHIFGILCFGGGAIVATMFVGGGNMLLVFSGWLFYCGAGAALSIWANSHIKIKTPPAAP